MFNLSQAKMLLDHANAMVRIINEEGKVVYANEAFKRIIADGRQTEGQRCYEVFGESGECDPCPAREAFEQCRVSRIPAKFNGRKYSINTSPIVNENGEVEAVLEVFRDITLEDRKNAEIARMNNDLHLARNMQNALVMNKNAMPAAPGYSFYSTFMPSEKVGGDMFDCLNFGNRMVMCVADVSGHGVMPAMLGVFFSRAVKTACSMGKLVPSEILNFVQKEFEALELADDSIYITAFLAVLNMFDGSFLYSNAGLSVVPIVYNGKITELAMSSLPISTWFEHPGFEDAEGHLDPGARLLIYTDGVKNIHRDKEVQHKLYEMFSREPFSAKTFEDELTANLHTKQEDDFTMLICSRDKTDAKF